MREKLIVSGLAILALLMAGCTGNFDVKQNEPFRVEVVTVDGDAKETRVSEGGGDDDGFGGDDEKTEFKVDNTENADVIQIMVEVTKVESTTDNETTTQPSPTGTTTEPAIILVIVEDRDKNEKLAERRVEADDQAAQVELNVDVKGRDNVVIITQAVQGTADVSVAAEGEGGTMSPTATATPTTSYARP